MSYAQEATKFARKLRKLGFDVEIITGSTHYRVTHPDYDGYVTFGTTPSDNRWRHKVTRDIRHTFGMRIQ